MIPRHAFTIGLFIVMLYLTGCDPEAVENTDAESTIVEARKEETTVEVYKYDGSLKCMGGGTDVDSMAQELTANQVPVLAAYKDTDGYYHGEACGMGTGIINVYEINRSKLEIALKLGFMELDALRDKAGMVPEI